MALQNHRSIGLRVHTVTATPPPTARTFLKGTGSNSPPLASAGAVAMQSPETMVRLMMLDYQRNHVPVIGNQKTTVMLGSQNGPLHPKFIKPLLHQLETLCLSRQYTLTLDFKEHKENKHQHDLYQILRFTPSITGVLPITVSIPVAISRPLPAAPKTGSSGTITGVVESAINVFTVKEGGRQALGYEESLTLLKAVKERSELIDIYRTDISSHSGLLRPYYVLSFYSVKPKATNNASYHTIIPVAILIPDIELTTTTTTTPPLTAPTIALAALKKSKHIVLPKIIITPAHGADRDDELDSVRALRGSPDHCAEHSPIIVADATNN